MVPMVLI